MGHSQNESFDRIAVVVHQLVLIRILRNKAYFRYPGVGSRIHFPAEFCLDRTRTGFPVEVQFQVRIFGRGNPACPVGSEFCFILIGHCLFFGKGVVDMLFINQEVDVTGYDSLEKAFVISCRTFDVHIRFFSDDLFPETELGNGYQFGFLAFQCKAYLRGACRVL